LPKNANTDKHMNTLSDLKSNFGLVVLLDALGASNFGDDEIRKFLELRAEVNRIVEGTAKHTPEDMTWGTGKLNAPKIFTFGDTVIMAFELNSKITHLAHLSLISILLNRFLFLTFVGGVMFRGSFSIGKYIADDKTNTVMGEAVSDAASWYEKSNWMGLHATPKTVNILESMVTMDDFDPIDPKVNREKIAYFHRYNVPIKNKLVLDSYVVAWPLLFHSKDNLKNAGYINPKKYFMDILARYDIPLGTEEKYINTAAYFKSCKLD